LNYQQNDSARNQQLMNSQGRPYTQSMSGGGGERNLFKFNKKRNEMLSMKEIKNQQSSEEFQN
jgi:hypothetical protein